MDIRFNLIKPIKRRLKRACTPTSTLLNDVHTGKGKDLQYSIMQKKGFSYEKEALTFLQNQGLYLLEKNLLCKMGEIDLVMKDGETLVFIEVRYRKNKQYGGAISSITAQKYQKLRRTALYFLPYLTQKHFKGKQPICRFDAIGIHGDETIKEWIKNISL